MDIITENNELKRPLDLCFYLEEKEVPKFKRKKIVFFCMSLIIIFLSIGICNRSVLANSIEDFTFSDHLVPSQELSWTLTTLKIISWDDPEDYTWELTTTDNLTEGDIFKVILLEDLDNLNLTSYEELFITTETWGNFYVNTKSLGDSANLLDFDDLQPPITEFPVKLIYPVTIQIGGETINTFDNLYDELKIFETSGYKLTNNNDAFGIEIKAKGRVNYGFGWHDYSIKGHVIYNKEWGILSSYYLYQAWDNEEIEMLLEVTEEDLRVELNYEWFMTIPVLIIVGLVMVRKKRKIRNQ